MFTINKGSSNSKMNSSLLCFTILVLLLFYFTTTAQPAAPTNLIATRVSKTQVNLSWKDNPGNGSGTISSPWNNLRSVNNFNLPSGFVAGDTIYLKRGTGKDYTVATLVNRGPDQAGRNLLGVFSPRGKGNSSAP